MKIHEFQTSWKVSKSEIRENFNTRKLPDLQYVWFDLLDVVGRGSETMQLGKNVFCQVMSRVHFDHLKKSYIYVFLPNRWIK